MQRSEVKQKTSSAKGRVFSSSANIDGKDHANAPRYEVQLTLNLDEPAACFHVVETKTGNSAKFYSRKTADLVAAMLNVDALRWELCS